MDYRIELVILPVSDVDRARAFYGDTLGWPVDHDRTVDENTRFVQVTPPGSACSIAFGKGLSEMSPGSLQAIQVVIDSADKSLADLRARGIAAEGVEDLPGGRFVSFADPDGNGWTLQELPDYSRQS
jgi:catechol 2,3-dioxygenase-like lactoylglutathione lyase family enzyme